MCGTAGRRCATMMGSSARHHSVILLAIVLGFAPSLQATKSAQWPSTELGLDGLSQGLLAVLSVEDNLLVSPPPPQQTEQEGRERGDRGLLNSAPNKDTLEELTHILTKDQYRDGKGKGNKKGQIGRLLLLAGMVAAKAAAVGATLAIMIPLALKSIALLAVKALIVGKIAITIAAMLGFLKLVSTEGQKVTKTIIVDDKHHLKDDDDTQQTAYMPQHNTMQMSYTTPEHHKVSYRPPQQHKVNHHKRHETGI